MRRIGPNGFTLIEMLVSLVVVGALLRVLLPSLNEAYEGWKLQNVSQKVAAKLRNVREAALGSGRPRTFALDLFRKTYAIEEERHGIETLPPAVAVSFSAARELGSGDRFARILFQPDGSSSGGALNLRWGNLEQTIHVDWLSSQVGVQSAKRVHAP